MSAGIEDVLKAYEALIVAEIQGGKRGRFERVRHFCAQAMQLERMQVPSRVVDADIQINDGDAGNVVINGFNEVIGAVGYDVPMVRAQNPARRGPVDQVDMIREVMMMVQPMLQNQAAATANAQRKAEIDALLAERAVLETLGDPTTDVDARLRAALAKNQGGDDAVVHTQLLRGHQAHEEGRQGDAGDGGARDPVGAEGADRAVEESGQEEVVARGAAG